MVLPMCSDSKYGVSTECLHFYCEECIVRSLDEIMNQGQFPAYCPQCRVDAIDAGHSEPAKGRISAEALTFLEQHNVVSLEFQFRFMRQQDKSIKQFFACPSGCGRYLVDQDPQYQVVPRGSTEQDGFERVMRLGKCACGARVCVVCHNLALQKTAPAVQVLEELLAGDPRPQLTKAVELVGLVTGSSVRI